MFISKSATMAPWIRTLTREVTSPVFPRLPADVRPYLLAVLLFAAASALMYIGDAALLRYGLPWTLVSLLVIVAAANFWGTRAAVLVLVLSTLYGVVVVPHLSFLPPLGHRPSWDVLLMRTILFVACGTATIYLTYRAQQMQKRAEQKREVVVALQSMSLPDTLADAPGYDLCSLYRPARREEEVGGDFYDFYPGENGQYGLLIGDVMGKGKEAAVSTALLRYSVRAFTSMGMRPAQILYQLNSLIETQGLQFETASLFLGFLNTDSGSLCYANAGHEPPLLKREDGEEEILDSTGPILGVGAGITYQERVVMLRPGDVLLLMTDGVTEARNGEGQFLNSDGIWRLLNLALRAPTLTQALASLDTALTTYIGTRSCDDIAMLLLQRIQDCTKQTTAAET